MPYLPLSTVQPSEILDAPDGALIFPISDEGLVLKSRILEGPVVMYLEGNQKFGLTGLDDEDRGSFGIAFTDYVIEVDLDSAIHPSLPRDVGDYVVGDDWSGIWARNRPGQRHTLLLAGDNVQNPRVVYQAWRMIRIGDDGTKLVLFEKDLPISE